MSEHERVRRPTAPPQLGEQPSQLPQYGYTWFRYAAAILFALVMVFAIFKLHYTYGQAPHRIVKMLVGMSVAMFVFFKPQFALHAWLLAVPIGERLPATGIPGLNGPNLLFLILFLSWVVPPILAGERIGRPARLAKPLGLYLALLAFALVRAAIAPPGGASYNTVAMAKMLWQSVLGFSVYYVVANTIRDEKQVRNLLVTFAIGCSFGALIAIREYLVIGDATRIGGALGDVNDLGAYFAVCASMLIGLGLYTGTLTGFRRLIMLGSAAAATVSAFLPKSRGAYVGLACGLGALSYFMSKKAFIVFVIVLATSPIWAPGFVKERMAETTVSNDFEMELVGDAGDRLDPSAGVRLEIWKIVGSAFTKSPIVGYGYGTIPYLTAGKLTKAFSAHSLYFETLGEMGLLGIAALAWLLTACVKGGRELLRTATNRQNRGLAVGFLGATAALLVANVFGQRFTHFSIAGTYFFLAGLVDWTIRFELSRRESGETKGAVTA